MARRYNDQNSTVVKALDFNERAIAKLHRKWPKGCRLPDGSYEPWYKCLAAIATSVLLEYSSGPEWPVRAYLEDRRAA